MDNGEENALSTIANCPDIVFDAAQSLTVKDVLASLPPRAMVDKLLSVYFNAKYVQIRKQKILILEAVTDSR